MLGPMGRLGGPLAGSGEPGGPAGDEQPFLPAYGAACLSELVPTLLARAALAAGGDLPAWLPDVLADVDQVVLLVLDGLGYEQLVARADRAPALSSLQGGPITSVAPTTTATALTSLATGSTPAEHGILGYRLRAGDDEVLNVLRWTVAGADARASLPPSAFCHRPAFSGSHPPVVSRTEFAGTGFTEAHLAGVRLRGWRMPSSIRVEVASLLADGEPFVYAYYDGIDKIAHETGLGEHFDAELVATDRIVGDLLADLPPRCALVVTADHGQVEVRRAPIVLPAEVMDDVVLLSGEGRFRWLHTRPGATERVAERCRERFGDVAWVRTRDEVVAEGWLGGRPTPELAGRLGDVVLAARAPVAFFDPTDTGELRLVARHGSLTSAEMLVPLLAWAP